MCMIVLLLATFLHIFADSWMPRLDVGEIVQWAPRKYNTVADHLVNVAMDCQSDWLWEDAGLAHIAKSDNARIKICVDGGLRRQPHNQQPWA